MNAYVTPRSHPHINPRDYHVLLINPPHSAIGSRVPDDHLPPLGLLSIGGPLLDAGFRVNLLDADLAPLSLSAIVDEAQRQAPDLIMLGHSGSTSAHPTVLQLAGLLRAALPQAKLVYGGVFPTYHWLDILSEGADFDFIVRGEGEQTALLLVKALAAGENPRQIPGLAWRGERGPQSSGLAEPIACLDDFRVGWELVDLDRYTYWGGRKAVVVQFSRGCPYLCSYCGQRGFWRRYRHRDPVRFAAELARLHREHGVEVINFADELPTGSRQAWQAFLEALIAEDVPLVLVGSTRAGDIVRDADILHLYKRAGGIRFLLGIESYDQNTLGMIRKDASPKEDREAIRLLRQHGIVSMATYVVGFAEDQDRDYLNSLLHLLSYDPDQIQLLYATPHRWTAYHQTVAQREVMQPDMRMWDYKHQVLATRHVPPWRLLLWVKSIETALQLRPRALARVLLHPDAEFRHAMRWYTQMGRRVWVKEVTEFVGGLRPHSTGMGLEAFWRHAAGQQPQQALELLFQAGNPLLVTRTVLSKLLAAPARKVADQLAKRWVA